MPLLFNLPEFSQLLLRKIFKLVATSCQMFRLKCTRLRWESLQRSSILPSCISGACF